MKLLLEANRTGYATNQIRRTMTVGELREYLEWYDDDVKVFISNDEGYTYGGITESDFREEEDDEDEEDDDDD